MPRVTPTTRFGLVTLVLSVPLWVAGGWLVQDARARVPPSVPPTRALPATVVELMATACGGRRSPGTCFRTVAAYTDGGQPRQAVSRTRYRPARHHRGESLSVIVEADGTAWIDVEWQARLDARQEAFERERRFPLVMGWMLMGCGAVAVLLGVGLIFWVDRT